MTGTRNRRQNPTWPRGARGAATVLMSALLLAGCSDSPEAMIESAKSYLAKNDTSAASIQLKNALQQDGNLAEGRFLLGKINLEQGNLPGAVKELERAAQLGYPVEQVSPLLARARVRSGEFDRVLQDYGKTTLADSAAQGRLLGSVGEAHLGKADLVGARAAFEAALALNPDDIDARVGLGRTKLFSGDAAGAQTEAEAVAKTNAGFADAHTLLADAMLVQNKPDGAVKALEAAVAASPKTVSYRFALISLLLRENDFERAASELEEMKKVAPTHPSTRYIQAFLDFRGERLAEARTAILEVVKTAPDFLPGQLLAGTVLMRLNEQAVARTHFLKVLEREPRQVLARRLLAASHLASGEGARALEVVKPLLGTPDPDPGLLGLVWQIYLANGEFDQAETWLKKSASGAPADAGVRARLGVARMAGGDVDAAFADLEAASGLDEKATQADLALIIVHMRRGEYDKALAAHKVLERKQPDSPQTHNLKGGVLLAKGDSAPAREAFEKAIELQPDFLAAQINLARLDLAEKKPEAAKARFEDLIRKNPKNVEALLSYADLQSSTGSSAAEVLATLDRATAAEPGALLPRLALAQHHLRHGDTAKAMTVAQQAAAAEPNEPRALELLARAQVAAGETQQALASLNKVAGLLPQSPAPLLMIADVQRQAKDEAAAEQTLRRALGLRPDLIEAQQRLLAVQVARGDRDGALRTARTVQQQRPKESVGYAFEGDLHTSGEKWGEAAAAYRKALDQGSNADQLIKLHAVLERAQRQGEADKLVADWLRTQPKDLSVRGYIAERALADKRYADATAMFKTMHGLAPDNPLVLNNLAWSAAAAKDPQALKYAEQALALAPDNPAVLDTAGMIQVESGQADKGLANLVRAVTLAPEAPVLRLNLAKTYAKLNRKADAGKELDILMPKLQEGTPIHAEATALRKTL